MQFLNKFDLETFRTFLQSNKITAVKNKKFKLIFFSCPYKFPTRINIYIFDHMRKSGKAYFVLKKIRHRIRV